MKTIEVNKIVRRDTVGKLPSEGLQKLRQP